MPTERSHLRDAVIDGVHAVDAVFVRLSTDVLDIVRRLQSPLDTLGRRWAMRQIDQVLNRVFGLTQRAALISELFTTIAHATDSTTLGVLDRTVERVRNIVDRRDPGWWQRIVNRPNPDPFVKVAVDLNGPVTMRQRAIRASTFDPNRRWVDPKGYRLSDRVWKGGREVRREIDRVLRDGIRKGESAVDLAARLERYLNPDKAPLTYRRNGQIVRRNVTRTPYGKAGSSFARSLARTEITKAHGAAVIESAKVTPGVLGVRWRLSAGHSEIDQCDDNATQDRYGLGPGVYPPRDVPRYPNHPQDVCALLPEVASREAVLDDLVRRYGA
jgi:hypothetical protein